MSTNIEHLLGLSKAASPLAFLEQVNAGLSIDALHRVARQISPADSAFVYQLIPKSTLARRQSKLNADESTKLARVAKVWKMALAVWGTAAEARAFLSRPHQLLEGQRPIDVVLASEFGSPLVEGILGRLQYGSAA